MSFVGCGKLKNIVGLSQPEAPIPPKVDSQLDTSASSEVNSQPDTSASSEVNSQPDTSASSEVNSQPDTSASSEVNSQPDTSASSEVNSQPDTSASSEVNSQSDTSASSEVDSQSEASSDIGVKDLMKKESWKEWTCRQWTDNKWYWMSGTAVVVSVAVCAGVCYCYFNPKPNPIPFQKNINSTMLGKEYLNWQNRLSFFSVNMQELPSADRLDWRKKNVSSRSNMWFNVANSILVDFAAFEDKSDLTNVKPFLLDALSNPKYNYPIDIKRRLRNKAIELYPNMAGFLNDIRMPDYDPSIG